MRNFEFYNPTKIFFGEGATANIGPSIKSNGFKKVLLIAGGGSIKVNGVYGQVIDSLKASGIESIETWGVQANPTIAKVREIIDLAKAKNVDALLAVGGGSVLDSAKAVAAGVKMQDDIWNAFEKQTPVTDALPLFTVLTLSATASEMDPFAVVTNAEHKKKWAIFGPALFPVASVIDPKAQESLPWNQTVNGAIDALSHIMEQYFVGGESEVTISMCEMLMRLVIQMADKLQKDSRDYHARGNLAWAATLALNGITGVGMDGGDWSSHNIEHGLSALNDKVAHGEGLGVVFPAWIKYVNDANPAFFERWAKNVWDCDTVDDAIQAYRNKLKQWGSSTTLKDLGFSESDIPALVENILQAGEPGAVKKLKAKDLTEILNIAM